MDDFFYYFPFYLIRSLKLKLTLSRHFQFRNLPTSKGNSSRKFQNSTDLSFQHFPTIILLRNFFVSFSFCQPSHTFSIFRSNSILTYYVTFNQCGGEACDFPIQFNWRTAGSYLWIDIQECMNLENVSRYGDVVHAEEYNHD